MLSARTLLARSLVTPASRRSLATVQEGSGRIPMSRYDTEHFVDYSQLSRKIDTLRQRSAAFQVTTINPMANICAG